MLVKGSGSEPESFKQAYAAKKASSPAPRGNHISAKVTAGSSPKRSGSLNATRAGVLHHISQNTGPAHNYHQAAAGANHNSNFDAGSRFAGMGGHSKGTPGNGPGLLKKIAGNFDTSPLSHAAHSVGHAVNPGSYHPVRDVEKFLGREKKSVDFSNKQLQKTGAKTGGKNPINDGKALVNKLYKKAQ